MNIHVTTYAEGMYQQFQDRLTPIGIKLLGDCSKQINHKLQDPSHQPVPSPTFPNTFVVEAMGLWFAWYRFEDGNTVTILLYLPLANVPHIDLVRSRDGKSK